LAAYGISVPLAYQADQNLPYSRLIQASTLPHVDPGKVFGLAFRQRREGSTFLMQVITTVPFGMTNERPFTIPLKFFLAPFSKVLDIK
jgi:hypothetical protein